jgi:hypothetical protein
MNEQPLMQMRTTAPYIPRTSFESTGVDADAAGASPGRLTHGEAWCNRDGLAAAAAATGAAAAVGFETAATCTGGGTDPTLNPVEGNAK